MDTVIEQHLQTHFGLASFRKGQKEIIEAVLANNDVLAVLPTGGGKSLCYQLPALIKNQLVIVISPLIALMKDQVAGLTRRGIPAGCLYSAQKDDEKRQIFRQMAQQSATGQPFLLYLSPERTQKEGFQTWFQKQNIALLAVDEAHCVSQWGHDFREEYAQLKVLKNLRPDIPVLALTASATPLVLADISRNLQLRKPVRHVHGFYRSNLYYQVQACSDEEEKFSYLLQALKQNPQGRVLVYCGTRKGCTEVAERLQAQSPEAETIACYHAGMTPQERTRIQTTYDQGQVRILVATNAFGMGIDHPDVRLVVHFNMPANIDSLYQEMGRAGRDGMPSLCLLLYAPKDKGLQSFFIQSSKAPAEIKRSRWNTLNALVDYAEGGECRHAEILTYYQDSQRIAKCQHCDVCAPQSPLKVIRPTLVRSVFTRKAAARKAEVEKIQELTPDQVLCFEKLRVWRKSKATELDVPAFVILPDRTLKQIAQKSPSSLEDLKGISGIGEIKLERFGAEILAVL